MPKTIKELSKELNCSYEAVRKQVKRYSRELKEHIYTEHKTQYLDDYACDFIRSKRADSPVVITQAKIDEATEELHKKYVALLEAHTALQERCNNLELENRQIGALEADNAAKDKLITDTAKEAQAAILELSEARKQFEDEKHRLEQQIAGMKKASCWQRIRGWKE